MAVLTQRLRRSRLIERRENPPFPWLIIGGAFAVTVTIIVLKEFGASDADTDYLSMSILIAALALASTLDRRTGLVVAILAGIISAIVPGSTSFTHTHLWDSLFRLCFLIAMSMSFYRIIVALRDREDHLQRQLANVQRLHEEVTTLHMLTARAPIDRDSVYEQIVRAALRLGMGQWSRLILHDQENDRWNLVAQWPPPIGNEADREVATPTISGFEPYHIAAAGGGTQIVTIPLSAGEQVTGALQLERSGIRPDTRESAQLLAIYARDATLTLEHLALQRQLEYFAVMGERGRIARDLHDGLVQSLAGIAFHLEYYRDALGPEAATVRAGFDSMATAVKEALHEARSMIHGLRSEPKPEQMRTALDELVDQMTTKTGIRVVTEITDAVLPITHQQASALLRIAQEALQNVVKHAEADEIRLTLDCVQNHVMLRIVDNGRGFIAIPPTAASLPHFGLIGMHERAALYGGELTIDSQPSEGTTVIVTFPVIGKDLM